MDNAEKPKLTNEEALKLFEQCKEIPSFRRKLHELAREDRIYFGGHYYSEKEANFFMKPMADWMIEHKKSIKLLFKEYENICAPETLYQRVMQTRKYLKDQGGEKYTQWSDKIKIQRRADHILIKVIGPLEQQELKAPIFHPVEDEEKGNQYQDLYEWIESAEEGTMYLKKGLNLVPDDIMSLNKLFDDLPQFTARIKHDEIKVIKEKIVDENTKTNT